MLNPKAAASQTSIRTAVDNIAKQGGTPLVVADGSRVLGAIRLKDVLKEDIKERLSNLRKVGIRSVMITGDNPMTAAAIAAEAGIDDFIGQATPEAKLEAIRKYQKEGHLVAMIGDGTNDAPALAQADVAVAMNAGTQAAREAANMVDLDSNPAKLLDIVEIGKQILITRGALTTFSVANDVSKYFAILPAIFAAQYPMLNVLNIMQLATPTSAVLSAIIFNAIIIPLLIPLALRGVRYQPTISEDAATPKPVDLRSRRSDCAFHRHQADRYAGSAAAPGVRKMQEIIKEIKPAVLLFIALSSFTGCLSVVHNGNSPGRNA